MLRSTMTDSLLTLWCLDEGDSTATAFPIKDFPWSNTVDDLKTAINLELELSTPSKNLALWRVSIPDDAISQKLQKVICEKNYYFFE